MRASSCASACALTSARQRRISCAYHTASAQPRKARAARPAACLEVRVERRGRNSLRLRTSSRHVRSTAATRRSTQRAIAYWHASLSGALVPRRWRMASSSRRSPCAAARPRSALTRIACQQRKATFSIQLRASWRAAAATAIPRRHARTCRSARRRLTALAISTSESRKDRRFRACARHAHSKARTTPPSPRIWTVRAAAMSRTRHDQADTKRPSNRRRHHRSPDAKAAWSAARDRRAAVASVRQSALAPHSARRRQMLTAPAARALAAATAAHCESARRAQSARTSHMAWLATGCNPTVAAAARTHTPKPRWRSAAACPEATSSSARTRREFTAAPVAHHPRVATTACASAAHLASRAKTRNPVSRRHRRTAPPTDRLARRSAHRWRAKGWARARAPHR
eukprot:scaffold6456_cov98-Isochrysis_galbana.AAC.14